MSINQASIVQPPQAFVEEMKAAEGTGRKTLIQEAHTSLSAGHPGI